MQVHRHDQGSNSDRPPEPPQGSLDVIEVAASEEESHWLKGLLFILLVGVVLFAVFAFDLESVASLEAIRRVGEQFGLLSPFALSLLMTFGMAAQVPEFLFIALAGIAFGPVRGLVYGWIAAMLSSTVTFLMARYFFRDLVQRSLVERFGFLRRLDGRLEDDGLRTMILLRLFLFLSPALNWAIGASSIRLRDYVLGSALGIVPGLALTVYFADRVAAVEHLSELFEWDLMATLLLVALFAAGAVFGPGLVERGRAKSAGD